MTHIFLWGLLFGLLAFLMKPAAPFEASDGRLPLSQAGSAYGLIAEVNAYRAANGLEPYGTDGGLMSAAQSHSEYIAEIQTCTHQRADGSGPSAYGISAENVACGMDLSVSGAIYNQWADALHSATILGPASGLVGAGVATNGSSVYYTLAVKRLSGSFEYRPPVLPTASGSDSANQADNQEPTSPVIGLVETNTPNADGSISHKLKYGETLVQIAAAYGVPLADLIGINKLDPQKPVYYEGQVLLVRLAYTATPEMTETSTPRPPTRTPLPTRTPRPTRTAMLPRTPLPTATATPEPLVKIPSLDDLGPTRNLMAYSFITISAIGLVVLIWSSFWPGRRD